MSQSRKDKRMDAFARGAFRLGALRGFRYFEVELRGREELLLTVSPLYATPAGCAALVPMNQRDALPPASPCRREKQRTHWGDQQVVVFLIGAYAHYAVPYVWVRAGHSFLSGFAADGSDCDSPLQLQSTEPWRERQVHAWEVVAELVFKVYSTYEFNPFELEPSLLDEMGPVDSLLMTGAFCAFLRDVHRSDSHVSQQVEPELLYMLDLLSRRLEQLTGDPELAANLHVTFDAGARTLSRKSSGAPSSPTTPEVMRIGGKRAPHSFLRYDASSDYR